MNATRMRGKKSSEHLDPYDPPRRRANKRRGRGTYANDRPLVLSVVGRTSKQVRLRMGKDSIAQTVCGHVERFTKETAIVYTDDLNSYNALKRTRRRVQHNVREWACDQDGDGIRECHTNTQEGLWTEFRAFLRPFRGVHKDYLAGYVAVYEHRVNLKVVSPAFIASIVRWHYLCT